MDGGISSKDNAFFQQHMYYQQNFLSDVEDDYICDDRWEEFAETIMDRKYEEVDIEDVCACQDHLSKHEKKKLHDMLVKYKLLFDGQLGCYPHEKFHIDIEEGAKPVFQNAYKVPYCHEGAFKRELIALLKEGAVERCDRSKWALPAFIIPKENQKVRWINNFANLTRL